ncbi:hypothetical protein [Synechococcus sp. 1G10]|uniref:hypothetical protein n=1 Tax=Synechococcus sp. 1G10 TaxID=2025605 RepID=UPI000B996144|nr:hypothetical protein [Synechococcus sp. 1G10]
MNRIAFAAAALTITSSGLSLGLITPAGHAADDEAKIEARVGSWGRNCKSAIADKFKAKTMADVEVTLADSLRTSIDAGEFSLADLKSNGLSYNFRVHHLPGKDPEGYCNTDGQGNVDEITNIHN